MGKTDSEDRLNQSKNILNFLQSLNSEVVLAGDFNLLPETKSIKILEDYNLTNLIKKYDIKSTRTSFYDKNDKYADYIFLSQGVKENVFKVLPDEVSDHAAMYLDI
jgi:endonuclease/exonuclease/phosphatase family metal-dependent hydrolase